EWWLSHIQCAVMKYVWVLSVIFVLLPLAAVGFSASHGISSTSHMPDTLFNPPDGYNLVFKDFFNEANVSQDRWKDNPFSVDHFNDEQEHYTTLASGTNISQDGTGLHMRGYHDAYGLTAGQFALGDNENGTPIFGGPYQTVTVSASTDMTGQVTISGAGQG